MNISLFGKLRAQRGDEVVGGLEGRKVQELLCYLLLYRDHPQPREVLADLLWGDHPAAHSRTYLRKALWQLQGVLGSPTESGYLLEIAPDWVQLNTEPDLRLDVAIFEQAYAAVQGVRGQELDRDGLERVGSAVDLYRGDLLEGWYHDWCLYDRERLQHMDLAMLDKLMGYCEAHAEYETGIVYGMRILRYDQARERTHQPLMRLHYLAGDRSAALRQYERCVATLRKELRVGCPSNAPGHYSKRWAG